MNIAVIGVGTAGILSLSHLLGYLPKNCKITSIYDPEIKILGIGETSTYNFPPTLFVGTNFTLLKDSKELDATIKLGASYINWRENDFTTLIEPPAYALHFNNFKLKDFAFSRFKEMWGEKFNIVEANVTDLKNDGYCAVVTTAKETLRYDYVIDCRGWPEDCSNDYNILTEMPVNSCLVNIIHEPGTWNTTVSKAHRNGWMFGIPLQTRQGWGYLYNDTITSKEDAMAEIAEIFNTTADKLDLKEFKFKNYYAKKFFDGRIIKNGNRALFFEPLEGMSGMFYDTLLKYFVDYTRNTMTANQINDDLLLMATDLELFAHYVYHGGSKFDSNYWNITKEKSSNKLKNSARWQRIIQIVRGSTDEEDTVLNNGPVARWAVRHWLQWDRDLYYKYFTKND